MDKFAGTGGTQTGQMPVETPTGVQVEGTIGAVGRQKGSWRTLFLVFAGISMKGALSKCSDATMAGTRSATIGAWGNKWIYATSKKVHTVSVLVSSDDSSTVSVYTMVENGASSWYTGASRVKTTCYSSGGYVKVRDTPGPLGVQIYCDNYYYSCNVHYEIEFPTVPTPSPTPRPTPSPTSAPTPWPTPSPTYAPTPAPTDWPTDCSSSSGCLSARPCEEHQCKKNGKTLSYWGCSIDNGRERWSSLCSTGSSDSGGGGTSIVGLIVGLIVLFIALVACIVVTSVCCCRECCGRRSSRVVVLRSEAPTGAGAGAASEVVVVGRMVQSEGKQMEQVTHRSEEHSALRVSASTDGVGQPAHIV